MRTFAPKQSRTQEPASTDLARTEHAAAAPPQRAATLTRPPSLRPGGDLSRIPAHASDKEVVQRKLTVGRPGDAYEREADGVSERVMSTPEARPPSARARGGGARPEGRTEQPDFVGGRLQTKRVESSDSAAGDVPPQVWEVLNSAGRPLDSAARAFMEPRFGHDFSRVRVHTDAKAAESARELNANAYTVGHDIVFGAGKYAPGTQAGGRLLSHELTHVLQQRRGLGPPQLALQRDAPQGGTAQPAKSPPQQPVDPPDYDRTAPKHPPSAPAGLTIDDTKEGLKDKIKKGDLTNYAVKGVGKDGNAEIFLMNLIYAMGLKSRWGTESDLIIPIGWPPKAGAPAPQGLVTLRIDRQGVATAELIARGGVPAVGQVTAADGATKLKNDFGFADVKGWGSTAKDAAEISDVVAALELLKRRAPQDVPALKGVELIRVASLGADVGGDFSPGGKAIPGTKTREKAWLKLTDLAFSAKDVQFFGGGPSAPPVPSSFQTILHEVGHAVEREELRAAQDSYFKAEEEVEAARQRQSDYGATFDADLAEAKRQKKVKQFYKERETEYKKHEAAVDAAQKHASEEADKIDKTRVPTTIVQPLETDAATKKTAAASTLADAKTKVQALNADEVQSSQAYVQAIEDTAASITSLAQSAKAAGDVDALEAVVINKADAREKAKPPAAGKVPHRAVPLLEPAVRAQDAWFKAERLLARTRKRTLRLQKFIELVASNNIRRFTKYSVENWELKPGEFYAEAYSLWLVDPEFLKTNYKVVYDFFQNGDYRK
ncbi:MAG TPA: DUF4157 domain-containing protein [Pyrinomonadaceae bacterium]|nr:DUF4157 domain-containing protein [Pyrinomonadaceae bacterium]